MVEGKTRRGSSSARYYQSIAALLAFSKIQKFRHREESDAFAMLIVCPTDVVILIYQPETDTFVISQALSWGKVTYFFVWAVLHHKIFSIEIPVPKECGFTKATRNLLFDDYWYLANRNVLQGNSDPKLITEWECVYRLASGSD